LIDRLEREVPPERARKLLTAAFLLTGLRVRRDVARQVFRGVRAMRDSDTYLAILDEGREEQVKKDILRLAQKRFGPADEPSKARLNGITDLERMERLLDRLLDATGWQDLLDTP
jgi:chorismate mutase